MTILYKLTDQNYTTYNKTKWGENVTHTAQEGKPVLCTKTVIHAYETPELAEFFNCIHCNFTSPILWKAEGDIVLNDQSKIGVKSLTTLHKVELPYINITQRRAIAIKAALAFYKEEEFTTWANNWLSGADRSFASAIRAATASYVLTAAYAAKSASYDTNNAANAANAAVYAANFNELSAKGTSFNLKEIIAEVLSVEGEIWS